MSDHRLVDDTLYVDRDENGKARGIIGRCKCGWNTGYRFSSAIASCAFQDHVEEMEKRSREIGE